MLGYLEYFTVKLLGSLVRVLPQKVVVNLGTIIGNLVYLFDRKHRNISLLNLKGAFGVTKTDKELREISRQSFVNLCQSFFEVLFFPKLNAKSLDSFVTIEGRKYLDMVRSQGKGGILLTAHFGNWELSAVWASLKGYPLNVLAREQKHTRLNLLLNQYRASSGLKIFTKGMAIGDLINTLRRDEFVGILGDQDAGRRGVFVNFFRMPASTHPGPALLALKTETPILPCFIVRSGFRHKIYVNPPIRIEPRAKGENNRELVKSILQNFNQILESYIWLYPEQWLWVHRRWKTQPKEDFTQKKIKMMVLNDGKPGHVRQSLGIVQGFPSAKVLEVKINFRSKFWKLCIPILVPLLKNSILVNFFLKKSLAQDSFKELTSFLPQVIISTGSSLAAYNLLYGRITGAKKIVCMKPGIIKVKFFDLVIAPQHDHLPIVKNVLNILTPPHPLRKEDFELQAKALRDKFSIKGEKFLGLLIGGESFYFTILKNTLKEIIGQVKKICEAHKFKILLTTSRRTPICIEEEIKNLLSNYSNLELFISPREESYNPVGGILGLSDITVVTEDSISMIAEAASSGKKIVVLQIDRKYQWKSPKHLGTIKNLAKKGYLFLAEPYNLSLVVEQVLKEEFIPKILNDTEKAIERVKELLVSV